MGWIINPFSGRSRGSSAAGGLTPEYVVREDIATGSYQLQASDGTAGDPSRARVWQGVPSHFEPVPIQNQRFTDHAFADQAVVARLNKQIEKLTEVLTRVMDTLLVCQMCDREATDDDPFELFCSQCRPIFRSMRNKHLSGLQAELQEILEG